MWQKYLIKSISWLICSLLRLDRSWGCRHLAGIGIRLSRAIPGRKRRFPVTSEALSSSQTKLRLERFLSKIASFESLRVRSLLEASLRVPFLRGIRRSTSLRAALVMLPTPCHLNCPGCYFERVEDGQLDPRSWERVIRELEQTGVYIVHLIGHGEIFAGHKIADIFLDGVAKASNMFFTLFTSGTGITPYHEKRICELDNLFICISIDGLKKEHDARRGNGSWDNATSLMRRMSQNCKLCAFSCTVSQSNWHEVTSLEFTTEMSQYGACLGIYFLQKIQGYSKGTPCSAFLNQYYEAFKRLAGHSSVPIVDQELFETQHGCRAAGKAMIAVDLLHNTLTPCVTCPKDTAVPFDANKEWSLTEAISRVMLLQGWQEKCTCMAAKHWKST